MMYINNIATNCQNLDSGKRTKKIFNHILNYQKNQNTEDPRFNGGNLDDKTCIECLEMLRKKRNHISFKDYASVWYYIWDCYNDLNRISIFKESLEYIESNLRGTYDTNLSWCVEEFDVYRVATVDGRSWSSSMKDTYEYYKCWTQNNENHGTLSANIYKKTIKQEDILIMCECNVHGENEIILKKKSLKNFANIERLEVSGDLENFIVKTVENEKLCGIRLQQINNSDIWMLQDIDYDSTMIRLANGRLNYFDNRIDYEKLKTQKFTTLLAA
mgnify:CR=1 FL=1